MAVTKLKLYNWSLLEIGERKLSSLSDDVQARHLLDLVWDSGEIVNYLLAQGHWNFASRTSEISYNSAVEPDFGYSRAFSKPSDWVRTSMFAADEYFVNPLEAYEDEAEYWFADVDTIYVKYVSNDNAYGNDMSLWPPTFSRWVSVYLASRICESLTQNRTKMEELEKRAERLLIDARSKDAMNEPSRFLPSGSWARSRSSGWRGDRGSRGRLIG